MNFTDQMIDKHQKILIVDDKEPNLFTLKKVLKSIDADVIQARNGQEALAAVLENDFALIILDVRMPGMDGYEVAAHLQGDGQTKTIPIIFVTAEFPDEEHMFKGYKAGAIDYIIKPYAPKILLSKVNILLEMDRDKKELQRHRDHLEHIVMERTAELSIVSSELMQFSWLLDKQENTTAQTVTSEYGDVTTLNQNGIILHSVGKQMLETLSNDVMDLLDTCVAVYEKNGDYAFGTFVSSWCGTLDNASRRLCQTDDNAQALTCGNWVCHNSCWNISKEALESGEPVDRECAGGLRIYGVPIRTGKEIIGVINFGYGTPPKEPDRLAELAETYRIDVEDLRHVGEAYKSRPPFIIEVAKRRLHSIARLIGEIVKRKETDKALHKKNRELELFNKLAVGRELRMIELKKEINALCGQLGQDPPYKG